MMLLLKLYQALSIKLSFFVEVVRSTRDICKINRDIYALLIGIKKHPGVCIECASLSLHLSVASQHVIPKISCIKNGDEVRNSYTMLHTHT